MRAARRLARRTSREELGLFLAEGPQAVREALDVPGLVREVFALPDSHLDLRAHAGELPWLPADQAAIASLSDTVHPQGVVAVCRTVTVELAQVLIPPPRLAAVCVDVRDPGNAGTLVRCADAAGADAVVVTGDSVDVHNGKAVRSSVGSLFHLPVAVHRDPVAAVAALQGAGLTVLAADGYADLDLHEAEDAGLLTGPTAWLFGNEARGLSEPLAGLADHRVRIPIYGRAESLNLATAAAVCLYASARMHHRR